MNLVPRNTLYLFFMLVMSVMALLLLVIAYILPINADVRVLLQYADTVICVVFLIDFLISLKNAPDRWKYLRTWGVIDLLSSIPVIAALRIGRVGRIVRIVRVLRAVRSARVLSAFFLERRAQSAILTAAMISVVAILFGSIAVLELENVPEANIHGPADALWWSIGTFTSVGYGDRYPVTTEGRIVAVILMMTGVMFLGVLSGFAAAWFLDPAKGRQQTEIDRIRQEIRELVRPRVLEPAGEDDASAGASERIGEH